MEPPAPHPHATRAAFYYDKSFAEENTRLDFLF